MNLINPHIHYINKCKLLYTVVIRVVAVLQSVTLLITIIFLFCRIVYFAYGIRYTLKYPSGRFQFNASARSLCPEGRSVNSHKKHSTGSSQKF